MPILTFLTRHTFTSYYFTPYFCIPYSPNISRHLRHFLKTFFIASLFLFKTTYTKQIYIFTAELCFTTQK